jgi:hypothetical protein
LITWRTETTIALVETPATPYPMSEQDDHRKNAEVKMVPRGAIAADGSHMFALAELECTPWGGQMGKVRIG